MAPPIRATRSLTPVPAGVFAVLAVLAAACAASTPPSTLVVRDVDEVTLDPATLPAAVPAGATADAGAGETASPSPTSGETATPSPPDDTGPAVAAEEAPTDTIPTNADDRPAVFGLLDALDAFNTCLDGEGYAFIGLPGGGEPNDPRNDPAYGSALATCAARSNIVQALRDTQQENADLTPDEIESRNRAYLAWRECMIGRGWQVPEPVPDANGVLGGNLQGGDGGGLQPPPGESLLGSDDLRECAEGAADEAGPDTTGESP